ncbi:MAG TPA: c-type cytochrome [Gemmatimonadales bacterium]|jgi:thiosulfate dehydrogenase|nr:c-type cytochrome [Gemmatimonadales bacterium]
MRPPISFLMLAAATVASVGCGQPGQRRAALVPDTVPLVVPPDSEIPAGPLGAAIRRGRALLEHTRDSMPAHVGNRLACTSCHPANGTQANAIPWVGVSARFPQYNARSASVITIEDRINGCFLRSMNGTAPPAGSQDVKDMVAYFAWLSRGVPQGARVEGQGLPKFALLHGDTVAGRALYASECARCHNADGSGGVGPALWGNGSYNIGAGMARLRTAGSFIRHNMPFDKPGTLTDEQAVNLAAFINAQPRPDLAGKEHDWPNGDAPPDAAYETLGAKR